LTAALLVDGHVHFHRCFTWKTFLDGASANFAAARRQLQVPGDSPGCLLFTETAGVDSHRALVSEPGLVGTIGWDLETRDDNLSLVLRRGGDIIMIVAGRQIVTAERLEVLAPGCADTVADGQPLRDVMRQVSASGAVPVIPWGFGKWSGRRGRLIHALLKRSDSPGFCLGDNGGRSRILGRPSLFDAAERRGLAVLGGSDPLPLATQVARAGSYGFVLPEWRDASRPAGAITERIRGLTRSPAAFGELISLASMLRSQVGIRRRRLRTSRHN
jgi:hypothetical protein